MAASIESAFVSVSGLRHAFKLGCTAEERAYPQIVSIDLTTELKKFSAIESDHLEDTVDYVKINESIGELAQSGEWQLVERLAGDIGDVILSLNPEVLAAVNVSVTKYVISNADGVTVEVTKRNHFVD